MQIESSPSFLGQNPIVGAIISWILLLAGEMAHQVQIPILVMQIFQLIVWSLAIIVSAATLYGYIKKNKSNTNDNAG